MYNLYYIVYISNRLNEVIEIAIYKNAAAPTSVQELTATDCSLSYQRAENNSAILAQEFSLTLNLDDSTDVSWETFLSSNYEDWKVVVNWGVRSYVGFLVPEDGGAPFRDKPYDVTLKFTDGLGLLKGKNYNLGAGFKTLKDVIVNCLSFTGLNFNIKAYSNLFHAAMLNKGDSLNYDHFNQSYINARTILKDSNSYENCYDTLRLILDGHYLLFQDNNSFVLWPKMNYLRNTANRYYVVYNSAGTVIDSGFNVPNDQPFGPDELIYPQFEDQIIKAEVANKSVKTQYNYVIPDDLVNNQKLQALGTLIAPLSGSGYSAYQRIGWSHKNGNLTSQVNYSGTKNAYIRAEFDSFNVENSRYYRVEHDSAASGDLRNFIIHDNTDFLVDQNDLISLEFKFRAEFYNISGHKLGKVALLIDGTSGSSSTDWWTMDKDGKWFNNSTTIAIDDSAVIGNIVYYNEFKTWQITDSVIPANGRIFILLGCGGLPSAANYIDFQSVTITYIPYLKGSKFYVTGDYNKRTQTTNFPDIVEDEVKISDAPKRLIKGALFNNLTVLFSPQWYYIGATGTLKGYKEWQNYLKYNLTKARYYNLQGSFSGTQLMLTDVLYSQQLGRKFMPELPIEINLCEGSTNMAMIELPSVENNSDDAKFDYIF